MVEALADRLGRHSLPAAGVVTCLTALGEASAMRIRVAIRTFAESDPGITRLAVGSRSVTFLAGDLGMRTGQWIARLRVVELADADGFPIVVSVALQTILAQPSFVLVLMTSHATCGNAEERLVRIVDFDRRAIGLRDVLGTMAAVAGEACVFALEGVSGLLVVEGSDVPLDERKVLSVMLRVATNAFLARARTQVVRSVQALPCGNSTSNFGVTSHALKRGLTTQLVTGGAIAGSAQRLVGPTERTGRDLSWSGKCRPQHKGSQKYQQPRRPHWARGLPHLPCCLACCLGCCPACCLTTTAHVGDLKFVLSNSLTLPPRIFDDRSVCEHLTNVHAL